MSLSGRSRKQGEERHVKFRNRVPVFVVCAIALAPVRAFTAQDAIVEIETRKGVTRSFAVVEPPAAPVASVIVFAGGGGRLRIDSEGIHLAKDNFLERTRRPLAGRGVQPPCAPPAGELDGCVATLFGLDPVPCRMRQRRLSPKPVSFRLPPHITSPQDEIQCLGKPSSHP